MKLSFAISLQQTSFNYIAKNTSWQKKIKLLAELGYQAVELGIRDPKKVDIKALARSLERNKLKLSAVGTGQAYLDDKLSLSSLVKSTREKAMRRVKQHIDLCSEFDAQVIIGLIRGQGSGKQYDKNLLQSVKHICDYAVSKDVIVTIEPLNRYETTFLNTLEDTLDFIKKVKCKNLKVLLDTFHMNIEEDNLLDPIDEAGEWLSHIHLADNNRRCPGEGFINFKQFVGHLKRSGYTGYLSGEMLPVPSAENCIRRFYNLFQPYIGE